MNFNRDMGSLGFFPRSLSRELRGWKHWKEGSTAKSVLKEMQICILSKGQEAHRTKCKALSEQIARTRETQEGDGGGIS